MKICIESITWEGAMNSILTGSCHYLPLTAKTSHNHKPHLSSYTINITIKAIRFEVAHWKQL